MRNITAQSIDAFLANRNLRSSNMIVEASGFESRMYLHHNLIAKRDNQTKKISIQTSGWKSNTTKERLNALPGVHISQKNYEWFLNGEKWEGNLIEI